MKYIITEKYYSKEDKLFHVVKQDETFLYFDSEKWDFTKDDLRIIKTTYDSFESFYIAVNKDLSGANLLWYNFDECDPNKYDLSNALISSKTMLKLGIYNEELFNNIRKDKHLVEITPSPSLNLVPARTLCIEECFEDDNNLIVCYISDLHINHKILNDFKESINEFELNAYLRNIVKSLKESIPNLEGRKAILFVGDISFNFEILKLFFKAYRDELGFTASTFFILGNHELWDCAFKKKCKSIDDIVEEYRKFFNEQHIVLLENQLYFPNDEKELYNKERILSEDEILNISDEELRKIFSHNGYCIFGGLGYAGLNNEFNYNQGIYRDAPITRQEEIERSKRVEKIHNRLRNIVSDKKIYFVTHMPKTDWSDDTYVSNWVYISGHTHQNYYHEEDNIKIYADNQVGYTNKTFGFKFLVSSCNFNLFCDYQDGIYEITREQYKVFYFGIGSRIDFNRKFKKLYLLKRQDTYCFLMQTESGDDLKLLNGGNYKNVGKHDLKYFYENIPNYTSSVKKFLQSYENFQKQVSREIRKIGGSGRIHGSIIDIDFYNHLYINPLDGEITPYFAYSMTEKFVYTNLISLLKANRKDLYLTYKRQVELSNHSKNDIIPIDSSLKESTKTTFVPETEMYRVSRILKGLQYTTKYNIVRLWNDTIANDNSEESGKLIVSGIINPEEMKLIREKQKRIIKEKKEETKRTREGLQKTSLIKKDKREQLFDKHAEKIALLSDGFIKVIAYTGAKEPASYQCVRCGYTWERRADKFIERGKGKCPKCQKVN